MTDNLITRIGSVASSWWREQQPGSGGRGDRAALARLRRAATPAEALLEPAVVALVGRAIKVNGGAPLSEWRILALGTIAATLARVRAERGGQSFAGVLGTRSPGAEQPLFSPLRFAALLATPDWTSRHRHLRRAVHQAGDGGFDLSAYARDVFAWSDAVRRRWTFQYYAIPVASSGPRPTIKETT